MNVVLDTNCLIMAISAQNEYYQVWHNFLEGKYCLCITNEIIEEYSEVLHRSKFHLADKDIQRLLYFIQINGIDSSRFPYDCDMPDEDDRVFYEVALSEEDSFLVTGNLKHFPKTPKVVTAAQMMEILDHEE